MANHPARHSEDLRNPLQARWECGKRGAKRVDCVGLDRESWGSMDERGGELGLDRRERKS